MEKMDTLAIQGNELSFINRSSVLTKNSSMGCSSRVYYYRKDEGIPFQWELQPGKAKQPPKEKALPPLSPPPALLNLGLLKPSINQVKPNNKPKTIRLMIIRFWKKSKKDKQRKINTIQEELLANKEKNRGGSDKYERFEFCSSDNDFLTSPSDSSSSSFSSNSLFFSNGLSRQSSKLKSPNKASNYFHRPISCSPFNNISAIMFSISRRV